MIKILINDEYAAAMDRKYNKPIKALLDFDCIYFKLITVQFSLENSNLLMSLKFCAILLGEKCSVKNVLLVKQNDQILEMNWGKERHFSSFKTNIDN